MKAIGASIQEAGSLLGGEDRPLSRSTIYRLINCGLLEAFKIGSRTVVTMQSIETLATSARRVSA